MKLLRLLAIALILAPVVTSANEDASAAAIEYLLESVGSSDCGFVRNGTTHDADDAESHLRMKDNRGKRYAATPEDFIERLASGSYLSKKPYYIECSGAERVPSGDWLAQRLDDFRARTISSELN